ncbi:DUF393 domain-containing protein [Candidatus Peregrinibacteria bacterium]|nr:DUF393 domain-containing protein [Candidatus Peregrinibacteria bacterium]
MAALLRTPPRIPMTFLLSRIQAFFFAPRSATGFGLMRILWGSITFVSLLMQWHDVSRFYSDAGALPMSLAPAILRWDWRFSLLDVVTSPNAVFALYLLLLGLLLLATAGWKARWTVVASALLLFSFHERNPLMLAGGDTLLRALGFLLMISPGIEALSVDRIGAQWQHWKKDRTLLPPVMMPAWPLRLLLWQFIVLYGTAVWYKLLGTMWLSGSAVGIVLHHPMFAGAPRPLMDVLSVFSTQLAYGTILFHLSWLLLLIPESLLKQAGVRKGRLKRWILCAGLLFHGSIFLLLHVGSFSFAIFAGYAGLLDGEDIEVLRRLFAGRSKRMIAVLYDGHCGLCLRSIFTLSLLDAFRRLEPVNFWNRIAKNKVAPRVSEEQLNRALHIKRSGRFWQGFDAFRELTWELPALWIVAPFLYIPGVAPVGRLIYGYIAQKRERCDHKTCGIL